MSNNDCWIKDDWFRLKPYFTRTVKTQEELDLAIKEADQFVMKSFRDDIGGIDRWRQTGELNEIERDSWEETMTACLMEYQRIMREC